MKTLQFASCQARNSFPACRATVETIGDKLHMPVEFVASGSWRDRMVALDTAAIDVGWICGTWYVRKQSQLQGNIQLLAVPVLRPERYRRLPIYYSDVVVHRESPFSTFADLRGSRWAYNEAGSHSGYNVVRYHLATLGEFTGYFGEVIESGAHQTSLDMIMAGSVDGAAIDSSVLDIEFQRRPLLHESIRIVETLGPSPIPPWVISTSVPAPTREAITDVMLHLHLDAIGDQTLKMADFAFFTVVDDSYYRVRPK